MERLDRLGWAAGISFTSFGTHVGVRVTDRAAIDDVEALLPPGWRPSPRPGVDHLFSLIVGGPAERGSARRFWILYDGWTRMARSREPEPVFETLDSLVRLKVAEFAPRRVFVHAGVVGWKGKAILIPGESFSGKTTLVSELLRAGATYYSDEYAVLDAKGRVHPFPSPLSIRPSGSYEGVRQAPEAFGASAGTKPLPVGLVVCTSFRDGARWRPRQLSAAEGALELLANTVSARRDPQKALSTLREAVTGGQVLRGTRGEAHEVARAILEAVS